MSALDKLKVILIQIFQSGSPDQGAREMSSDKEKGKFKASNAYGSRNFEADYNAASYLLKQRMNSNFPDSYHARLESTGNNTYDHGASRALAVDTVSTAIAAALRDGATVQQAADAGAASVGI